MIKLLDNGILIETEFFTFPDGTRHVKIKNTSLNFSENSVTVVAQVSNSSDIMDILLLKDAIDRETTYVTIGLHMPYMLGSRQDRIMVDGEPLSVQVYANILNLAGFDEIVVLDAHSSATVASLKHGCDMPLKDIFYDKINIDVFNAVVVSPDAGAIKRATTFANEKGISTLVKGDKTRDLATGKIIDFNLYADLEIMYKDVYIVDDIVTNGGTFLGLLEKIKEYRPNSINLVVTHADHGEGLDKMAYAFDNVYVTNSKRNYTSGGNVTVIDVFDGAMN